MRRAFLALIGAALLLVSDRCPESAAAEQSVGPDLSLVAAVRVLGREQWASTLLDEDPATLRILLAARDSDLEPPESVELAVHITAAPESMREDGTFSSESSASPLRVQLDDIPMGVCARLPCALTTSCSVNSTHTLRVAPLSDGSQPQDLLRFSLGIEAEVVGNRAIEAASDRAAASGIGLPAVAAAAPAADTRGEWEDEASYVAILFPPDGECISDVAQAYLSIAITDNFFKLKGHSPPSRFPSQAHATHPPRSSVGCLRGIT